VGALSIVRFRPVRDTGHGLCDLAVVVGMAVGASQAWVAVIGIVVVGAAAALMLPTIGSLPTFGASDTFVLTLRLATGLDLDAVLGGLLDAHLEHRQLRSIKTARQGISIDVSCHAAAARLLT
jgi:hypothetical protein